MTVASSATVSGPVLEHLAASYTELPPALRTVHPLALQHALRLAHGDVHRLYVDEDGDVVVTAAPCWWPVRPRSPEAGRRGAAPARPADPQGWCGRAGG